MFTGSNYVTRVLNSLTHRTLQSSSSLCSVLVMLVVSATIVINVVLLLVFLSATVAVCDSGGGRGGGEGEENSELFPETVNLRRQIGSEPIRNRRMAIEEDDTTKAPFGKRPFGPWRKFNRPSNPNLNWVAYFFEESAAIILESSQNEMVDCTIIELSTSEEQSVAFGAFSSLMRVVPLPGLAPMLRLIADCGELASNERRPGYDRVLEEGNGNRIQHVKEFRRPFSFIMFPGTLWCGTRDVAGRYENLGERSELDKCCRAHDHCPVKVLSFKRNYGVTNFGFGTKSHCWCEEEFYWCLKRLEDKIADAIGNFYFDVLKPQCLQRSVLDHKMLLMDYRSTNTSPYSFDNLYACQYWDEERNCRYWKKNRLKYCFQLNPFHLKY